MKSIFLLLLVSICFFSEAQKKTGTEKLFYFLSKENLVGVKDAKGKIIIPAVHEYMGVENNELVKRNLIYLFPHDANHAELHSFGLAYNREGKVLFAPFNFDNGPDYFNEGMSRYVKNGKMGFVNRIGNVVIEAKYDYVGTFNYGIAKYCNGCVWDYSKDSEHPELEGGISGYINYKGEELALSPKSGSTKDQFMDSGYLRYPFSYTAAEQKIIVFFDKQPLISKVFFVNYNDSLSDEEKRFYYEIVERPSSFFPYYHVKAFTFSKQRGSYYDAAFDLNFYISKNGEYFYSSEYDDMDHALVPFDTWLKEYVQSARDYLKENPDARNRF